MAAALGRAARKTANGDEELEGVRFIYLNLLLADGPFWADGKSWADRLLTDFVRRLVGENIDEIVKSLADSMRQDGWRLGIDAESANHFLLAMSPEGKLVVNGWGAVHGPKEYEAALIRLADALAEETRLELLAKLEAQNDSDRAWIAQIGA